MADDVTLPIPAAADDLYEADFYLWSQAQAEALARAGEAGLLPPGLDWARLAEEVGDLGRSSFNACRSLARAIIVHLYQLQLSRNPAPRGHWRAEILAFRADLQPELTTSLRSKLEAQREALHQLAAEIVREKFTSLEPTALPADFSARWTLAQNLGEAEDPLREDGETA